MSLKIWWIFTFHRPVEFTLQHVQGTVPSGDGLRMKSEGDKAVLPQLVLEDDQDRSLLAKSAAQAILAKLVLSPDASCGIQGMKCTMYQSVVVVCRTLLHFSTLSSLHCSWMIGRDAMGRWS